MACGYVRPSRVILTASATGKAMSLAVDTTIGKRTIRPLGDPDFVYASDSQFHILREATSGEWIVVPDGAAINPTFLNGGALTGKSTLRDGAILTIGPTRLKLVTTIQLC
jgi:hypothetical protein